MVGDTTGHCSCGYLSSPEGVSQVVASHNSQDLASISAAQVIRNFIQTVDFSTTSYDTNVRQEYAPEAVTSDLYK